MDGVVSKIILNIYGDEKFLILNNIGKPLKFSSNSMQMCTLLKSRRKPQIITLKFFRTVIRMVRELWSGSTSCRPISRSEDLIIQFETGTMTSWDTNSILMHVWWRNIVNNTTIGYEGLTQLWISIFKIYLWIVSIYE